MGISYLAGCKTILYRIGGEKMAANLDAQIEKVISQKAQFTAKSLGLGMLLTRMEGKYKADPTRRTMQACVEEVKAFIEKYRSVLDVDLASLSTK
jgi:hypothetical protein